jgi:hypothetical protein
MSESSQVRRRNNELLDSAEELASGVGRLGYSLLFFGIDLLPAQSRGHMRNAVRELSYAFAELPGTFAEIAGAEIEAWAAEGDERLGAAATPGATGVRRVRVYDSGVDAPTTPAPATATAVSIGHIEHDPPGRDLDGEYVLIRNTGSAAVNLKGWRLQDGNAHHVYLFPDVSLAPGAELKLWTKSGLDDGANLYWAQRGAVWNNEGDTGTLSDPTGAVVSSLTYVGKQRP